MKHAPGFLRLCEAARARVTEVDAASAAALLASDHPPVLVDVREDSEWAAGRIPGAVHLGRGVLERDVEGRFPDPATPLLLYCGGGYRSALAAVALHELGYTDVRSLAGGVRGWPEAGAPWDASPPHGEPTA
jgi:rhodanese-related sulfurtransferase